MAKKLKTGIIKVIKFFGGIGMIVVIVITTMMTVDVILRYIFNRPLLWSYDAGEYLMVCFTYFGLAYSELREDHVNIDLIYSRFGNKSKLVVNIINRSIMLALSIIIAHQSWLKTIDSFHVGRTSTGPIKIPQSPVEFIMFIGWLSLCSLLIVKLAGYIKNLLGQGTERNLLHMQ